MLLSGRRQGAAAVGIGLLPFLAGRLLLVAHLLAISIVGGIALAADLCALAKLAGSERRPSPVFPVWLEVLVLFSLPVEERVLDYPLQQFSTLPSLRCDSEIDIAADLARVTLTQIFANPHGVPMRAEYQFPLDRQAAVHAMEKALGGETAPASVR